MAKLKTKPAAKKAAAKEIDVDFDFLFNKEDVSIEEILKLREPLYLSNPSYNKLERAAADFSPSGQKKLSSAAKAQARKGIALWLLNKTADAIKCFEEARSSRETDYFLALCYKGNGDYRKAFELASKLYKSEPSTQEFLLLFVDLKLKLGAVAEALELLQKVKKDSRSNSDMIYYTGLCLELLGRYADADKEYRNALHLDAGHKPTLFRMAYNADLNGNDEEALRIYELLYNARPAHVGTLLNLGLLYEDRGDYVKAHKCFDDVLRTNPLEPRARLYIKDVMAAETMHYDEHVKRKAHQTKQLLNQAIADFRLSVRARNCMDVLKVRTLSDLIQKTEDELMKCEGFGHQTLAEITELLARRGLTLAQTGTPVLSLDELVGAHVSGDSAGAASNVLQKSVFTIDWSARVRSTMDKLKVYTVADLVQKTEKEFLGIKNFGQTSLNEIKQRLKDLGLALKED